MLTMSIKGNVTFNQYITDKLAGNLTINNMYLVPGENKFPVQATIDQAITLQAAGEHPTCEKGQLTVKQLGTKVVNHGQEIPWLEAALGSANASVIVDLNQLLGIALNQSNYKTQCS